MPTPAPPAAPARAGAGLGRLATALTVLTLVLIAIGGAVRATDSGLACPTWPGCFSAGDMVPAWQVNVWLEHTHRLVAGILVAGIAALLVGAVRTRRRALIVPAAVALVAVLVQAGLGALVVLHLLQAELVTAHLGMGMLVLACLLAVAVEATVPRRAVTAAGRGLARICGGVAALTYVQILVGGHVTGVGAGLAFVDGPWLGIATFGPLTDQAAAFNVVHRLLAAVLVVAVGVLATAARRAGAAGWPRRLSHVAGGLLLLQVALGVANLAGGLSALTVVPHLAVASWLWAVLALQTLLVLRGAAARPLDASAAGAGDLQTMPASQTADARVS